MKKMTRRNLDLNQWAKKLVDVATTEKPSTTDKKKQGPSKRNSPKR